MCRKPAERVRRGVRPFAVPGGLTLFVFLAVAVLGLPGCGPKYTYLAAAVPQAIEDICLKEYNIQASARVVGKTVGAMIVINGILDRKGQVPKEVHEQVGKLMQTVTRVALSTDLPIDFCTVVIRDKSSPNELLVIRSLEDSKRANADAIGIEESINRTLFGQGRYETKPSGKNPFILKEVKMESFLADQIVQRVRFNFSKDLKPDAAHPPLVLVEGVFENSEGRRVYRFSVLSFKPGEPRQTVLAIFRTINEVLSGYRFTDFDDIEIHDYMNHQKLVVNRQMLLDYQKKIIKDNDLIDRFLTESQSVQEAFKLFGFDAGTGGPVSETTP